jgi:hypothetical protein
MVSSGTKTRGIILVSVLWLLQSLGRLFFAILGTPEGMGQFLDVSISYTTSLVMFVMFLLLGICGLIAAFGLWRRRKWGFWGTIAVSIATIVFDVWGITVQYTAALGFVVPAITLLYLYPKKSKLLASMN